MSTQHLDQNDPVVQEIIGARVNLLFHKPFFGNLATRLIIKDASTWCQTASTDGKHFYYNRDFIKSLTKQELIFLLGHEILHCVYDHLGRRGNREPKMWNMANDYIVNYTLKKENLGQMPEVGLISDKYTDEMTSEEVYADLDANSVKIEMTLDEHLELGDDSGNDDSEGDDEGKSGGSGDDNEDGDGQSKGQGEEQDGDGDGDGDGKGSGGSKGKKKVKATVMGDENGPPKLSEEDLQKIRNEMKTAVIQAAQTVGAGKVPAGVRRLIAELTEPKIDWRTMLEMHIQSALKDDYTFLRPSKKSWASGCMLPGQNFMDTIDIFCWMDTSGSMSEEMLRDFLSEVKGIMETFSDFKLRLGTFDTDSYNVVEYTPNNIDDIYTYDIQGGGGTDFMAMDKWMKANLDEPPMKVVVFTDGYAWGEWGDENYCPDTLWIIHYDPEVEGPYGTTVLYNTDGTRGYH